MTKHLERDLDYLKKELLTLGTMVSDAIDKAIVSLIDRRIELAREVMEGDDLVNETEVHVEEECLKMLALHQPVAADLRFLVVILKVNDDLERMGDLAVNIAERASYIAQETPLPVHLDFPRMVETVQKMVRDSLSALVNKDTRLARKVIAMDDIVDGINRDMYTVLQNAMMEDPAAVHRAVHLLSTSRHLERIADLTTNIAEDVVFMVDGEMIRHRTEEFLPE